MALNIKCRNRITAQYSGSKASAVKRGERMSGTGLFENYEKKQTNGPALLAYMDPLDNNDRLRAMRAEFTSVARDCPFYNEKVRSRCLVDPHVIYLPECTGRSFAHGICCPKILQSSVDGKLK